MLIIDAIVGGNPDGTGPFYRTKKVRVEGIVGGKCGSAYCQCRREFGGREVIPTAKQKAPADKKNGDERRHSSGEKQGTRRPTRGRRVTTKGRR